jgi:hypothetical protein
MFHKIELWWEWLHTSIWHIVCCCGNSSIDGAKYILDFPWTLPAPITDILGLNPLSSALIAHVVFSPQYHSGFQTSWAHNPLTQLPAITRRQSANSRSVSLISNVNGLHHHGLVVVFYPLQLHPCLHHQTVLISFFYLLPRLYLLGPLNYLP